jgi:nitrogenase molybdenum-iron protein beta chain
VSIVTDIVFRPEDRDYITAAIRELEYARPPEVVFTGDQWEINQALSRFPELALIVGSTNEREYAMSKNLQFLVASYPNSERLIYNRAIAGYRGALSFLEDLYSNT